MYRLIDNENHIISGGHYLATILASAVAYSNSNKEAVYRIQFKSVHETKWMTFAWFMDGRQVLD